MKGKIALEEHYEIEGMDITGSHNFTKADYFSHVEERLTHIDLRIQDMDKNGIETYIMSLTQPGIEGITDTQKAIEIARQSNDYCAKYLIDKHPDRLKAFACVPMQDPTEAAKELERTVKEYGYVGALINGYSNLGDENTAQYLDEPQVEPFWSKVAELNVPVYLHPRIPMPSQQRMYKGYEGLLGSAWGFGIETATHAVRLMLSGLFDRYPHLTVIVGHLGETLPFTLPRLEHRLRHQRVETQGPHKKPVTEYLRENFYLTTSGVFRTQTLINTLLELGSDRILFSVDSPYEDANEIAPWFDACPISEIDRYKIGRTNAKKLFHL